MSPGGFGWKPAVYRKHSEIAKNQLERWRLRALLAKSKEGKGQEAKVIKEGVKMSMCGLRGAYIHKQ